MVLVDEFGICWGEEVPVDEIFVVGAEGQILEPVEAVLLSNQQHIFNADSILSGLVVSWLVGDDHARFELGLIVPADSHWGLVHACEVADSVAGSVAVVESLCPEVPPGQDVDIPAAHLARRPLQPLNVQISQQHSSERVFLFWAGVAEVVGPGDIGGAIEVLSS